MLRLNHDSSSEQPVSELRTVLRNSTIFLLFPIEFFIVIISPECRVGDFISGTKLISTYNKKSPSERLRTFQLFEITKPKVISFLVATVIAILTYLLLQFLITQLDYSLNH